MITCCKGRTARRRNCHFDGQCVHWMQQQYLRNERELAKAAELAGRYGMEESLIVNRYMREKIRKKTK
jgi:hypothetical protein